MKKTLLLFLFFLFALTGCNLVKLAESSLYPFAKVNKKYQVPDVPPEHYGQTTFQFSGEDGSPVSVHAWYYQHPNNVRRTLVYFHGNGENLKSLSDGNFLKAMEVRLNANFVVIDYPSYGRSVGTTNEYNFVTGASMAIEWAARNFPTTKIIVWGRSMGAGVATLAAGRMQHMISGLILTSPWTNFYEVAVFKTSMAKDLPKEWIAKNNYNSAAVAPSIRVPILIHHGLKDKIIPIKFGRTLSALFPNNTATLKEIPNKEHNDIFQEQSLWSDISAFQL